MRLLLSLLLLVSSSAFAATATLTDKTWSLEDFPQCSDGTFVTDINDCPATGTATLQLTFTLPTQLVDDSALSNGSRVDVYQDGVLFYSSPSWTNTPISIERAVDQTHCYTMKAVLASGVQSAFSNEYCQDFGAL